MFKPLKTIARIASIALSLVVLTVPATQMHAQSLTVPAPPKVVTGGDPQPTGEAVPVILILPSLIIL